MGVVAMATLFTASILAFRSVTVIPVLYSTFLRGRDDPSQARPVMPPSITIWASNSPVVTTSNRSGMSSCTSSRVDSRGKGSRPSRQRRSTSLSWRRSSPSPSLLCVRGAPASLLSTLLTVGALSLRPSPTLPTFVACSVIFSAARVTRTTTRPWTGTGIGSIRDRPVARELTGGRNMPEACPMMVTRVTLMAWAVEGKDNTVDQAQ
mmetsp:Transcript_9931/g.18911  ORF Transcript_9931/g.18911 Transcript_9931/m.18911 type:complete len:207 (+) Transcript_9931:452-1072(+)